MRTVKKSGCWNIVFGAVACTAGLLTCAVGVGNLIVGAKLSRLSKR